MSGKVLPFIIPPMSQQRSTVLLIVVPELCPPLDESCPRELAHIFRFEVPGHDQHDHIRGVHVQSHTELFHAFDQNLILLI